MKFLAAALCLALLAATTPVTAADCPEATAVEKLSKNSAYKVAPWDLKAVTKAKATKSVFGITVFLSNADFDVKAAANTLSTSPVKGKGQVSLAITFMNAS